MSSSTFTHRFLLDENIRAELYKELKEKGLGAVPVSRSATDAEAALASKLENRILVTNDADFASFRTDQVYAVVLLRIPQNDLDGLLSAFARLQRETKKQNLRGKLIVLRVGGQKISDLRSKT